GNGDGTFSTNSIPFGGPTTVTPLFVADVNGDGALDIIVADGGSGRLPLLIQSIPPILAITPQAFSFVAGQGGSVPDGQQVSITKTGGGTANWTATASAPWIVLDQQSGTAPSVVSISSMPGTLAPGTYTGSISISAPGASNSPLTINITLTIQPP